MAGYPITSKLAEDVSFQSKGLTLSGKRWGKGAAHKMLALHGWMDNCYSYMPIADYLEDVDLVAVDAAGHGLSDFRSPDSAYNVWQDIADIDAIREQLGWQNFSLIGHSRGAIFATLYAGTFPDHITQLILIDGFVPQPLAEEKAPEQLVSAIRDNKRYAASQKRFYSNRQEALSSQINGPYKLINESAECLSERGLLSSAEGFYWRVDRRLRGASEVKLTKKQIAAFVNAQQCQATILACENKIELFKSAVDVLALKGDIEIIAMPTDSHHFHMNPDTVEQTASIVNRLLSQ